MKSAGGSATGDFLTLAQLIGRVHRRYLDVLAADIGRAGVSDISATQLMVLFAIGPDELSIRELTERGNYSGSNVTATVKHLTSAGYLERDSAERDRRLARIKLTGKAERLLGTIQEIGAQRQVEIARTATEADEVAISARTLMRLDLLWTGLLRYGDPRIHGR